MSAAIIAATAAVAGVGASIYTGNKAAGAAKDASRSAQASSQAQLDFDVQRYEDQMNDIAELEGIFGPIRENLNKYYQNMSVEQIELRGKTNIEKEYQRSNEQIDAVFSNNGMYNSGQRASAQVALEAAREETTGRNRLNAESQFNAEQLNWLNVGLQEENSARGLANSAAGSVNQAYSNQANTALQGGSMISNANMTLAQGYGDLGSGFAGLAGYSGFGSKPGVFGSKTNISQSGGDTFLSFT